MPSVSDEQLYDQLRAGDEAALEVLVARYYGPLRGFLARQLGDPHLAEDLTQEAFTRIITWSGPAPERFRPWAYTIAVNLARDQQRSSAWRRERVDADALAAAERPGNPLGPAPAPALDEALLREADRERVAAALRGLPSAQREVLILRFWHELKLEEIAAVAGVPLGTVKSRLFHALKRLRTELTAQHDYEYDHEGGIGHAHLATRRSS